VTLADRRRPTPVPSVNTRELDLHPIIDRLRDVWPELAWNEAVLDHGAFHGVAVVGDVVVRVCVGAEHAARTRAELRNTAAVGRLDLPFRLPVPVLGPHVDEHWTAAAYTRVMGAMPEPDAWADARRLYLPLLEALAAVPADSARAALRPVRDWCGGNEWPALVEAATQPLEPRLRERARTLADTELDLEAASPVGVVHGDLHAYNLAVAPGAPTGVIDLDNAAVCDPAHDLVWLARAYSAEELAADLPRAALARARHYGATGPLKIAAAARLIGDRQLERHAIENFVRRAGRG
jgi:aminoglycoside phosphotransferase (APT) family kinase protein